MGVLDGQSVNQAITNPAFINKNQDDTMGNILGFNRAGSGSSIADIQFTANRLYAATGASESSTGTVYGAPANTITDGDSHETALTDLADKFSNSTGHDHDGSAGNGNAIATSSLSGTALLSFTTQGSTLSIGSTGNSYDVSAYMGGYSPSSNSTTAGVVVNTPYNRVMLLYGDSAKYRDQVVDASGNLYYGRLTYAASVWTLSFYVEISGVETAASIASGTTLLWFFRQLQNPITSTSPNYNSVFEMFSKTTKTVNSVFGNITLAGAGGTSVGVSGQTITFTSPALSSTTPESVGTASVIGVGTTSARADHVHQGVHSVAVSGNGGLYGDVVFEEAGNITLVQTGNTIQISATTAVTTIGTIDAVVKSANGAVISGATLYMQSADATYPGLLSVATQNISGLKNFLNSLTTPSLLILGSSSGTFTQTVPATVTDYSVSWPSAQASGVKFLQNDGSGNLSWASAVTTVGTIDSQSKSANGSVISGNSIVFQTADASFPGMISTTSQAFSGAKVFNTSVSTPSFVISGATSGQLTMTVPATTTSYAIVWPGAQSSGVKVLQNDGSGNLSWAAASAGTVNTIGTIDSTTKSANGAVISSSDLILQTADNTYPGLVSVSTQNFAGVKTFTDGISTTSRIVDSSDPTKKLAFDLSGATTAKTLTILSSFTNNRTWTVIDTSDTFVGTTATQTISNKVNLLSNASHSSNYSVATTDNVLFGGGAAFAFTLPSAASNPGRIVTFYKYDGSFSNIVTVQTTGGDSINSGGTSTTLNTFGESITVISDGGTNWPILSRTYPQVATTYSVVITGTTTNPSSGTIVTNVGYYRREGNSIYVHWSYEQSSAGSAGSGSYLISLPSGLTIDTAFDVDDTGGQKSNCGYAFLESDNGSNNQRCSVFVYDSTHLAILLGDSGALWGSGSVFNFGAANTTKFSFFAKVTISGWK